MKRVAIFVLFILVVIGCTAQVDRPPPLGDIPPSDISQVSQGLQQQWASFCSGAGANTQCLASIALRNGGYPVGNPVIGDTATQSGGTRGAMAWNIVTLDGPAYYQELQLRADPSKCLGVDANNNAALEPCSTNPGANTALGLQWGLLTNWNAGLCLDTQNHVPGQTLTWTTCSTSNPSSQGWTPVGYLVNAMFPGEFNSSVCCSAGICYGTYYWLETGSFCCQSGQIETASSLGQCASTNLGYQPHPWQGGYLFFYDFTSPGYYQISQRQYGDYGHVTALLTDNGSGLPTFLAPTGDDTQRWYVTRSAFPIGVDSLVASKSSNKVWTWEPFTNGSGQHEVALASYNSGASAQAVELKVR
jgi:hypothetical protein